VTRVVIDTNVLVSGFVFLESVPSAVLLCWERDMFELIASSTISDELDRTLQRPYFAAIYSEAQRRRALRLLRTKATHIELSGEIVRAATHPEDDLILATVALGQADYLVTGDRQLLALGMHAGARIVTPRAFLAVLDASAPAE
jgi:putative PIN family toxin of toxin-antitoxin system